MRAKIENLSLDEIYNDYCLMKAMDEKYYYGGTDKIKNASEALMNVLKEEIMRRTLKELETNRNDNAIRESAEQIAKDAAKSPFKFQPPFGKMTTTQDFTDEFQNYTTSVSCGGCEAGDVHYNVQG